MKQRTVTALVLIGAVLAILFSTHPGPVMVLALVCYFAGVREIARLLKHSWLVWLGAMVWPVLLTGLFVRNPWISAAQPEQAAVLGAVVSFVLGVGSTYMAARRSVGFGVFPFLASGWVAGPLAALITLHLHHLENVSSLWRLATPVLLSMAPIWAGDTAAIFAGKAFGRRRLWPALSPKKTWEGSLANLFACVVVAVPLAYWIGYDWRVGLMCGVAAGILGQYGDLFESWVKRQAGLKDSGSLLPGHGGVLDRIDSMLFAAPAVALILILWHAG